MPSTCPAPPSLVRRAPRVAALPSTLDALDALDALADVDAAMARACARLEAACRPAIHTAGDG